MKTLKQKIYVFVSNYFAYSFFRFMKAFEFYGQPNYAYLFLGTLQLTWVFLSLSREK